MPRLFFEYNGIPASFEHSFKKIDKTTFVVVYKSPDNSYIREDFTEVKKAIDFQPETTLKLTFVCAESKEGNINHVIYRNIEFIRDRWFLKENIERIVSSNKFSVDFGLNEFKIKKEIISIYKNESPIIKYEKTYHRRNRTQTNSELEYVVEYFELIPRFEDIFLEAIFFINTMIENNKISTENEIEDYFLQSKIKFEKNKPDNNNDIVIAS